MTKQTLIEVQWRKSVIGDVKISGYPVSWGKTKLDFYLALNTNQFQGERKFKYRRQTIRYLGNNIG